MEAQNNSIENFDPRKDLNSYVIKELEEASSPMLTITEKGNNENGYADFPNNVAIEIFNDQTAFIHMLYVKPSDQDKDIGKYLLREGVKLAIERHNTKFFSSQVINSKMLFVLSKVFKHNIFSVEDDEEIGLEEAEYEMNENGKSIYAISFGLKI